MAAPTVTWFHQTPTASDDDDIAWGVIELPAGAIKFVGGWAEASDEYGSASAHYTCTPTSTSGHLYGTSEHPIVGIRHSYDSVGDVTYVHVGFKCPPGQQVRTHIFVLQ